MPFLKVTERGRENWDSLDRRSRLRLLERLLDRRQDYQQWHELSPDIVSIGIGFRVRATKRGPRTYWQHPCLKVAVREKLVREHLKPGQEIPERVQLKIHDGRSNRVYAVPVDISVEAPEGRAQGSQAIECSADGTRVEGSYSWLVHDARDQHYLLTCHHVAACSLQDLSERHLPTEAHMRDSRIGRTTRAMLAKRFAPNIDDAIDAALVELDDEAALQGVLSRASSHMHLNDYARDLGELQEMARDRPRLLSRANRMLPCKFDQVYASRTVRYGDRGLQTRILRLAQFTLKSEDTRAGYSGGAIANADGVLLAMHIAGVGRVSYSIPAYLLIDNGYLRTRVKFGLA